MVHNDVLKTVQCACNGVATWAAMALSGCTLSWLSLSRSESMTAVVPITVRRRRCSDLLSDSIRLAPWQETDSNELYKGAQSLVIIWPWAGGDWPQKNTLTLICNRHVGVTEGYLKTIAEKQMCRGNKSFTCVLKHVNYQKLYLSIQS